MNQILVIGLDLQRWLAVFNDLSPLAPASVMLLLLMALAFLFGRTRELTLIPIGLAASCLSILYFIYHLYPTDLATLSLYARNLWTWLGLTLIFHFWIRYLAVRRSGRSGHGHR